MAFAVASSTYEVRGERRRYRARAVRRRSIVYIQKSSRTVMEWMQHFWSNVHHLGEGESVDKLLVVQVL